MPESGGFAVGARMLQILGRIKLIELMDQGVAGPYFPFLVDNLLL